MDDKNAYVNYLKVVNGAIIYTNTVELTKNLNDNKKQLMSFSILNMREKYNSIAGEIILPFNVLGLGENIKITVPQKGDKKKLLELSEKNVKYFLLQKQKDEINKLNRKSPAERILKTLQKDLQMDEIPFHIECFDISNIQGTNPAASCVVFKNAKPFKKDYRHFKIKTVEGPDDFASMEEIISNLVKYSDDPLVSVFKGKEKEAPGWFRGLFFSTQDFHRSKCHHAKAVSYTLTTT